MIAQFATMLFLSVQAAEQDVPHPVWGHLGEGYYVEAAEAEGNACEDRGDRNWIYIHQEARPNATIPDVFSTFEGWLGFQLGSEAADFYITSLGGYGLDLDEDELEFVREVFDGWVDTYARGVGVEGGGLGYTTAGEVEIRFAVHVDTGNLRIYSASTERYKQHRQVIEPAENVADPGFVMADRQLSDLVYCGF